MSGERLVYLNGELIEESQVRISPFDRGFLWGDGVYEVTPSFDGRLYRLGDHIDRLYRSLRYVRIEPEITREEMEEATVKAHEANLDRLEEEPICRLGHWISRGVDASSMKARDAQKPTVFMAWRPMALAPLAQAMSEGVRLTVTATRRNPPGSLETRAKVMSKMNQTLAELDADAHEALSLMLDMQGNVAENSIANFFLVRDGVLWTAPAQNVLEGVTRKAVFELAARLGISVEERNFTLYDVAQAEEFFLTSSATCAMPVREIDRFQPAAPVPGPVTKRLIAAFAEETGFDFVKRAKTLNARVKI